MKQFILLIISFCYGSLFGLLYSFIFKKINYEKYLFLILKMMFFIIITLMYIYLIYILNQGTIHLYMKLLLILGFILMIKVSNICKNKNI